MNIRYTYIFIAVVFAALTAISIPYRHIRANMPIDAVPATIGTISGKTTTSTTADTATLAIGRNRYQIPANNSAVLDAMNELSSTRDFKFTGKDYPSLGFFVESINGKKNADGFYWILYVNGKSSDLGVSQAKIRAGDTIEWKYEKGI